VLDYGHGEETVLGALSGVRRGAVGAAKRQTGLSGGVSGRRESPETPRNPGVGPDGPPCHDFLIPQSLIWSGTPEAARLRRLFPLPLTPLSPFLRSFGHRTWSDDRNMWPFFCQVSKS